MLSWRHTQATKQASWLVLLIDETEQDPILVEFQHQNPICSAGFPERLRWTRMLEFLLAQVHDHLKEEVADFWHMPHQGFVAMLHDWPESPLETKEQQGIL